MDYKEKLEEAKRLYESANADQRYVLESLFSELKESEDERIRKALIDFFNRGAENGEQTNGICDKDILTWIEKQGEHANFRNKIQIGDKVTRNEDGVLVNLSQLKRVAKKDEKQGEQKPAEEYNITGISSNKSQGKLGEIIKNLKQEWSEEDEKCIRLSTDIIDSSLRAGFCVQLDRDRCVDWLKSIRPQNRWKPSDEQMIAIQEAMNIVGILTITGSKINSLYQDLKKLRKK